MSLRPYQQTAFTAALNWIKYKDSPAIISIPTGGGKSHIIASLAEHFYRLGQRVVILAHRKELLEQNEGKIVAPCGIYSAGLEKYELDKPITVAGIQSIYKATLPAAPDVILCDECHRIPNNAEMGMYWRFINQFPNARLVGFTATPFRLTGGKLGWGEVVYDVGYSTLLKDGYLSPLVNKVKNTPDLGTVEVTAGDYHLGQLEAVMEDSILALESVKHIKAYSDARRSCLIFCVSVRHVELLCLLMQQNSLTAGIITGETPPDVRASTLEAFRAGGLKYVINCEVLLEGFDFPALDMIVCLRPTKSKTLWEQMIGRGVRIAEGKTDCLLIDMSGNLREHGGLGSNFDGGSKREKPGARGRICPECESWCESSAVECPDCHYVFLVEAPPKVKHAYDADTDSDAMGAESLPMEFEVRDVSYREHKSKKSGKTSIKVEYFTDSYGGDVIAEWISPYSDSMFAREKAWQWFKERGKTIYTTKEHDISFYSIDDLLFFCDSLKKPISITAKKKDGFWRIIKYEYQKDGSGDTASTAPVASDILGDDYIPF